MPLAAYFDEQLQRLRNFMEYPVGSVLLLTHEPDLRPMVLRMLTGLARAEDTPHLMSLCQADATDFEAYCRALLVELAEENREYQTAAESVGVEVPTAPDVESAKPDCALMRYLGRLASALPADRVGSQVLILAPDAVADLDSLRGMIELFAKGVASRWVKCILLLSPAEAAALAGGRARPEIWRQEFALTPDEIERRITGALYSEETTPMEQMRYAAMLGGFRFARGEHAEAAALHRTSLAAARELESPIDEANSLFQLGNTALASESYAEAEAHYAEALDICVAEQNAGLMAPVLTNLGVALLHQDRRADADESFATAQRVCLTRNDRPGAASILDTQGQALRKIEDAKAAERCWLEALDLYAGITSAAMAPIRATGEANIHDRLRDLYEQTGQSEKLAALPAGESRECCHAER